MDGGKEVEWRYLQGAAAPGSEERGTAESLRRWAPCPPPVAVARVPLLLGLAGRERSRDESRDSTRKEGTALVDWGGIGRWLGRRLGESDWVGVLGWLLTQFREPHHVLPYWAGPFLFTFVVHLFPKDLHGQI